MKTCSKFILECTIDQPVALNHCLARKGRADNLHAEICDVIRLKAEVALTTAHYSLHTELLTGLRLVAIIRTHRSVMLVFPRVVLDHELGRVEQLGQLFVCNAADLRPPLVDALLVAGEP